MTAAAVYDGGTLYEESYPERGETLHEGLPCMRGTTLYCMAYCAKWKTKNEK